MQKYLPGEAQFSTADSLKVVKKWLFSAPKDGLHLHPGIESGPVGS
jgi:hypothetical protein